MPLYPRLLVAGVLALSTVTVVGSTALAQRAAPGGVRDWHQWRGPNRTGISAEKGLLKSWPAGGPTLLWKTEGLGGGYSTPSFAAGKIFGMGYRGQDEVIWARNQGDGAEAWSYRITDANRGVGYPDGSRCTPTVDGDLLYAIGVSGDLLCLEAATGKVRWQKHLVNDFGGAVPNWGYTESPLIDGEKVIFSPGGKTATIVALNKKSGAPIWQCAVPGGSPACYASGIVADVDGQRQYITYLARGVYGVNAADGKFLWHYASPANGIVCTTPVYQDHMVFATTAYDKGGGAVSLKTNGGAVETSEAYFSQELQNHHGGVVLLGEHMYYFEGFRIGRLVCREFKTGKLAWADETKRKGSLVYADGMLYCRDERGEVSLVPATPEGYRAVGSFPQPNRSGKSAWSHPVVAGGKLYIRDQDVLLCYDVKSKG